MVVESTFFLKTRPLLIAGQQASIQNLAMRFNTYDPDQPIEVVGDFKICANFRLDDGFQGARRTTVRTSTSMQVSGDASIEQRGIALEK